VAFRQGETVMAFINKDNKELQIKIVYVGPGRSGKTTNLQYLCSKLNCTSKTELKSIKTHGDRTLFFDYFLMDIGKIYGCDVKVQFYTTPGQIKYNMTNRLVLRGLDGIVFVADSMAIRKESNINALENLSKNLADLDKNIFKIPFVMQYNKRDIEGTCIPVSSFEEMEKFINFQLKADTFLSSAIQGINVIETARRILYLAILSVENDLKQLSKPKAFIQASHSHQGLVL
jgi:signal recognition particle receptor subunit beta